MKQTSQNMDDTAATGRAGLSIDSRPTVAGAVPPALATQFQNVPAPALPEVARLPRPRERCAITGASRTWLIERNEELPATEKFIFRVRERGKMRGAVFVNVSRLLAFMQRAQAESEVAG